MSGEAEVQASQPTALSVALENALHKFKQISPGVQVALNPALVPPPNSSKQHLSRRDRKIMANLGDEIRSGGESAIIESKKQKEDGTKPIPNSIKVTLAGSTVELPYTQDSEKDRKQLMKVAVATSWANVIGQVAGAALAIVGAVAMTWAIVQGVRSNTKSK